MTRTELAEIWEVLNDAIEYVSDRVDVVDGDYGIPQPNTAMRLHGKLNEAFGIVDRELDKIDKAAA